MKNRLLYFFVLLLITGVSTGIAQQQLVCRGKIVDSDSNSPMKDVMIYKVFNGDTVMFQSNAAGEFQIPLQTGSRLLLKKSGYAWQIVRVNNNDFQQIKMVRSKPLPRPTLTNPETGEIDDDIDLYIDGQLVPKSDVNDAMSGLANELSGLRVIPKQGSRDGRGKIYMRTL